jgi:hypothetical protein
MTAALKRILEEAGQLSETERRELRALLQATSLPPPPVTESALEHALAAQGLLSLPTSAPADGEVSPPIETRGRPLSEILLEERR